MEQIYAEQYARLHRDHWWWRSREQFLRQELRCAGISRGPVLDIGCGGGWNFEWLRELGDVSGVEPDPILAHQEQPWGRIHCAPFDPAFAPDTRYTLITMLDTLEHMPDPKTALSHAVDLLAPNGILVITVPAMMWLWTSHDDLNHHYTRYSKSSLGALANACDLDIKRMRYFFSWLAPVKLAVRLKERISGSHPTVPSVPRPRVNALLQRLSEADQRLARRVNLPLGSSLLCIGQRRQAQQTAA